MLSALFLWVAVGLLAPRFGPRQNALVIGIAVTLVLVYLFQGARFM
jgi:hypothetical protein